MMKRTLSAILVMILCLTLCACGASAPAPTPEPTPNPGELLYNKYADIIDALEAEDYDGAVEAVEALRPAPEKRPSHEVAITMDNWAEYFELVEIPKATAFGELECLSYVLKLQDQYEELVDYDTAFKIDVSHIDTYKGESNYDYDYSTNTLTLTGWRFTVNDGLKNTSSINNISLKRENEVDSNDYSASHPCEIYRGFVYDGIQVYEVSIDNIKGSIYLYD